MTQEEYNALNAEERELIDEVGLDYIEDDIEFIRCTRCGRLMIEYTEEHYTAHGCLCDCCYGDLFG